MADILYVYGGKLYANLTNRCCLGCTFCIRKNGDGVGSAKTLWHEQEPAWEKIREEIDGFNFSAYRELTFCGYGEPTYALDNLLLSAAYLKERAPEIMLRLNTNGLSDRIHGKPTAALLAEHIDTVSISLNAPTKEKYQTVSRPVFEDAYESMLRFAGEAKKVFSKTVFTVVDVISQEDIEACRKIADEMGIVFRVRKYTADNAEPSVL